MCCLSVGWGAKAGVLMIEQIIQLRKQRLTYREIGRRVGVSRTTICNKLKGTRYVRLDYRELDCPDTFVVPDHVIAEQLRTTTNRVTIARRKLGIKPIRVVNLLSRQRELVVYLLGDESPPGRNPRDLMIDTVMGVAVRDLTAKQKESIERFYIHGKHDRVPYDRLFRHLSRKKLKAVFDLSDQLRSALKNAVLAGGHE